MGLFDAWAKKILDVSNSKILGSAFASERKPSPYSQIDIRVLDAMLSAPPPFSMRKDPTPVSDDKPRITTNGMRGFSEAGAPEDWDMAIGEVYGYRWWKLHVPARFAGFLDAPVVDLISTQLLIGANLQPWEAGKNEAKCTADIYTRRLQRSQTGRNVYLTHEPPEIREPCGCGYWAYFDKELQVATHFNNLSAGKPFKIGALAELPVFGVAKGTGRVIIGEKGFRSQYAEIVGLCLPEVAQGQLSWWTKAVKEEYAREYYGQRGGRGADAVFRAMTGSPGYYDGARDIIRTRTEECSPSELLARIATVEGILSDTYPEARVFSDQDALTTYFPPDANYAPKPDPGQAE